MKTVIRLASVPPSVNHMWRHTRSRRDGRPVTYRTAEYMTWLRAVEWEAKAQAARQRRWTTPVYLTVAMRRPRSNADLDNRLKPVLDLLQHVGVLSDDRLVAGINCWWSDRVPGVEIAVTSAEAPAIGEEAVA